MAAIFDALAFRFAPRSNSHAELKLWWESTKGGPPLATSEPTNLVALVKGAVVGVTRYPRAGVTCQHWNNLRVCFAYQLHEKSLRA